MEKTSHYDLTPTLTLPHHEHDVWQGMTAISKQILTHRFEERTVIVIDYYHGVSVDLIKALIASIQPDHILYVEEARRSEAYVSQMLLHHLSDDRVFGSMSTHRLIDFYDQERLNTIRQKLQTLSGIIVVYGVGAALVTHGDVLLYGDLTRWNIQLGYRAGLDNWGAGNYDEDILRKYKRGYFVEWRVLDRHKMALLPHCTYILDCNDDVPKMMTRSVFEDMMTLFSNRPFRLVPYFDEGVWGGKWMESVCGVKGKKHNLAWCFDGVPEENAIRARIGDIEVTLPAMDLVKTRPVALLGEKVYARFGAEFPIRFDFLDTMDGGNLSLQVHPVTDYIHDHFNMSYTQDESYYILDAKEDACVYLGVKDGVTAETLLPALQIAQETGQAFCVDCYINIFPVRKHDHILIPAGTIHCSGKNTMVLEISATPYIFTFKLYDWGRVGLDGRPRPIHIERGAPNIRYDRTTSFCREQLINDVHVLEETPHLKVEHTGLHALEFIETTRYTFDHEIQIDTQDSVNMINLVEGEEAVLTSVDGSFEPYVIHYVETVIIPACVKQYHIAPHGRSTGQKVTLMTARVRV